tara:strand:- start:2065 stop:2319 length:255 start_codon:yes stop_codon:yes gene_type:complete
MTHLDKVIRNLEKELEQLKRINTMLKSDDLRQILYRTETRVGKDLDALDFDCYDNQTGGAEIQRTAIIDDIEHSKYYYDYDRNR